MIEVPTFWIFYSCWSPCTHLSYSPSCSGADWWFRCGEEQPVVTLHPERVQPGEQEHHRGGVCHTQHPGRGQDGEGSDLGHSWAGAVPGHHFCVSEAQVQFVSDHCRSKKAPVINEEISCFFFPELSVQTRWQTHQNNPNLLLFFICNGFQKRCDCEHLWIPYSIPLKCVKT